jgi:hypothetical protein
LLNLSKVIRQAYSANKPGKPKAASLVVLGKPLRVLMMTLYVAALVL